MKKIIILLSFVSLVVVSTVSLGQDDGESKVRVNGYMQVQSGIFVPLSLDGIFDEDRFFQDHKNVAYLYNDDPNVEAFYYDLRGEKIPCNPAEHPYKLCFPYDHGSRAGQASMAMATLQLEVDWAPLDKINVHGILRARRSLALDQDYWAQPPVFQDPDKNSTWVRDNVYNELDLREFYIDFYPNDWLSLRIGRQQVTWGQTGQYRLLDVINPSDVTWHFGPLEDFRDTRIPLWIAKALIGFDSIRHDLELVWVPGIDRPEDSVTVPLSFAGAWGIPYTNTPSSYFIQEKRFLYPSQQMPDSMRGGLRWKGDVGRGATYSIVYYYTHQTSPPIPIYYDKILKDVDVVGGVERWDPDYLEAVYLDFPRQHIIGASFDYAFDSPISMVAQFEGSVEPDRSFPRQSADADYKTDESHENVGQRVLMKPVKMLTINYAVRLLRPTMIRALNQTERFMFVLQWMQEIIPGVTKYDEEHIVVVPGYNDWGISTQNWKLIFACYTKYFHGTLTPKVVVAYIHPNSGFVSTSADLKLGDNWRILLSLTDFFGEDPYKNVGLFRDRDEINLRVRFQF